MEILGAIRYNKPNMIVILIVYIAFLIIWVGGSVAAIYHNLAFYEPNSKMKVALMAYIWVAVILFLHSFYLVISIDWSGPLMIRI